MGALGPYTEQAEQFPSAASKQQWRAVEWNADKKVNVGPEKEAATICGAFVRHTPLFHPLAFLVFGVILFKFFDMKGRRPETEHQQPSAGHLSDIHPCFILKAS